MEIIDEKTEWDEKVKKEFSIFNDIYFKYDYFSLFANTYKTKPEAIYWEDNSIKIFWSHLIREINNIEYFKNSNYLDLITPYGYGGPLIMVKNSDMKEIKKSVLSFFKNYTTLMKDRKIISEFVRFHPIYRNWEAFEEIYPVIYSNQVVAIDLTQDYEEIWNNMTKNNRYYTRKAIQTYKNVNITNNPSDLKIEEFHELYSKTMEKNEASQKYFFSKDFIKDHFKFNCLYVECKDDNGLTGAISLFLQGCNIMHYHLSATNYNVKNSPSRSVLWHAIKWAKEKGIKWFHLGGGVGKEDNLFNFKKGFSKTYFKFYMGKIIHNNELYQKLAFKNPNIQKDPNFFPSYRAGMNKSII